MHRLTTIAAILLASAPGSAFAVPMLTGDADSATGILDLEIGGTLYDVTFSQGETTYEEFWPAPDVPTFFSDPSDLSAGFAAAAAVAAVLNANSVTGITNLMPVNPMDPFITLFIPVFIDEFPGPDLVSAVNINFNGGTWTSGGQGRTGSQVTTQLSLGWVRFDPVPAPEPAALALFGIGLLAMFGFARRGRRSPCVCHPRD